MARQFACKVVDVGLDTLKQVELGGDRTVCIGNSAGEFFACQAYCPHQGIPLCEGVLDGSTLTCLEHLWQWDVRSGESTGLAEEPLKLVRIHVEGDSLYVDED